jgi:amino acid adenylation domain-containing protein
LAPGIKKEKKMRQSNSISEKEALVASQYQKEGDYWLEKLSGELIRSHFPYDLNKTAHNGRHLDSVAFRFSDEVFSKLTGLTNGRDSRLHMFLAASLVGLLYKYTGNKDIVIGVPIYKQDIEGEFINTVLAIRSLLKDNMTFKELVLQLRTIISEAVANQNYPVEALLRRLNIPFPDNGGDFPLFDAAVLLENIHDKKYLQGIHLNTILSFLRTDEYIEGKLEYNPELYEKTTMERLIKHVESLIRDVIFHLNTPLSGIDILAKEEKLQQLYEFNDTASDYPRDKTIHELFSEKVIETPDNIAIVGTTLCGQPTGAPVQLSYKELDRQSLQLAYLLQKKGVAPGDIVGLKIKRSVDMIVGILGILKTGAAYLPIRLDYPEERITYMMKDSGARVLVTEGLLEEAWRSGSAKARKLTPCSSDLAYVIYTSGTAGMPKGVLTKHANVIRVVKNTNYIDIKKEDRVLQLSSYAFDGSVFDIYGALLNGASLVLVGEKQAGVVDQLASLIRKQQATVFFITTSLFNTLVDWQVDCFTDVRKVLFGGERVSVEHSRKALEHMGKGRIIHVYGPTETTVYASCYSIDNIDENAVTIPIGKPISNTTIFILDKYLNHVPIGVNGEVYIGGDGTACGYLNHPELTSEKFCRYGSHRLYRSGDLARWLADGNIEFTGRIDHQVKLRGFRIELGEIETQLLKHDEVKEAVVMVKEDQESIRRYLCAYIVPAGDTGSSVSAWRDYLSKYFPDYMVPSYFVVLKKLPLTANGKLDRRALPEPEIGAGKNYVAPTNPVEEKMAAIWSDVLGIKKEVIGIDNDFFDLGGHSLKSTILIARIHKEFNVKVPLEEIFIKPTIRELSQYMSDLTEKKFSSIEPVEEKEYYELSSAQKRLYVLQQMETGLTYYNIPAALILEGEFDREQMEAVFRKLIRRHESLRTCFRVVNQKPVQKVFKRVEFGLEFHTLGHPTRRNEKNTGGDPIGVKRIIRDSIKPFDLTRAPLMRAGLVKIKEKEHLLLVDMHHIITDGTSMGILIEEFMALYSRAQLNGLPIQYKDFAQWFNKLARSKEMEKQKEYWLKQFEGEIPKLELPMDYQRPVVQSFEGSHIKFQLDKEETLGLNALASGEGVTMYMAVLAVFNVLLAKLSGNEDLVIGTPVAVRRHADLQRVIGMFVNTLALRNSPAGEKKFATFMKEVKKRTLEAFENQEYPFEDLVEKAAVSRETNRNPLFDVMFTFQNIDIPSIDIPGLTLRQYGYDYDISKFDMIFYMWESDDGLLFSFEYCTKIFRKETMVRFSRYFRNLISAVREHPGKKISELDIISAEEKKQLLFDFNDTQTFYPNDKTIAEVFKEQVEDTPDAISVQWKHEAVTYRELNSRADGLADYLLGKGLRHGSPIGIMADVSLERIIGILGILKAGGAYVPVNIAEPRARKNYILEDIKADILLTDSRDVGPDAGVVIRLDDPAIYGDRHRWVEVKTNVGRWSDPAYIMYTSGSTGYAKGVVVKHRNVVRLVKNTNFIEFRCGDRMLQAGVLEFDASTFEIWGALLNGLSLFLVKKDEILTPGKLGEGVVKNRITTMWMTAPLFNQVVKVDIEAFNGIRHLVVGGDVLSPYHVALVKKRFPRMNLINGYGPTENTTFSTTFLIEREFSHAIPIGKPIANSTAGITDKYNRPVPLGVRGELVVGGDGVSMGYLNQPELTAEKFVEQVTGAGDRCRWENNEKLLRGVLNQWVSGSVGQLDDSQTQIGNPLTMMPRPHPETNEIRHKRFAQHIGSPRRGAPGRRRQKIYKTGDLCRWLPDGNIEIFGREDQQVKIRGFRVELAEIENRLVKHDEIQEAVVITRKEETGEKYLCAYVLYNRAIDKTPDNRELKDYLSQFLPGYMIPSYFVPLERIPLTPNGKIDRKALPNPEPGGNGGGYTYMPPGNEIEKKLARIWSEVLGIEKGLIGINTDFFQLGGHSLKATTLAAKMHKEFDVKIPLVEIFKEPTIRGLARYVNDLAKTKFISIEPVEKKEYYRLSSPQKRLYGIHQMAPTSTVYNMPRIDTFTGELEINQLKDFFIRLIQRHDSLRTYFELIKGEPVQRIHDIFEFEIEYPEVRGVEDIDSLVKDFVRPFDLLQAPLMRVRVVKLPHTPAALRGRPPQEGREERYLLMVDMHHIISDGFSLSILVGNYLDLYEGKGLPTLKIQYKDYSEWQYSEKVRDMIKKQGKYWLNQLEGELPVLHLPADYENPGIDCFEGDMVTFEIGPEGTGSLKQMALDSGTTMYMVLLAVYYIFLSKLSGQEDIIVGSGGAGRTHAELDQVIGMFINTFALRNYPPGGKPFREFLKEVKGTTLQAFENQEYQFENLMQEIVSSRDKNSRPLFDVVFALQNIDGDHKKMANRELKGWDTTTQYEFEMKTSKFDLTLNGFETEGKLVLGFEYRTKLFNRERIERYAEYFKEIINSIIENKDIHLSNITISHNLFDRKLDNPLVDFGI